MEKKNIIELLDQVFLLNDEINKLELLSIRNKLLSYKDKLLNKLDILKRDLKDEVNITSTHNIDKEETIDTGDKKETSDKEETSNIDKDKTSDDDVIESKINYEQIDNYINLLKKNCELDAEKSNEIKEYIDNIKTVYNNLIIEGNVNNDIFKKIMSLISLAD